MMPPDTTALNGKLRILILNWRDLAHPKAGGAEIYAHNVAREWIKVGHQVTLFCAAVDGRPATEDTDGLHIVRRGTRFGVYREARRYYQHEGRGNFDLVIDEVNTRPFLAPKWVDDVPVVAIIHQVCREIWQYEMPFPISLIGRYWLEPKWLRAYRDVQTVTLSQSSKESLEEYGLRRITVVPVGRNYLSERPSVPREPRPTVAFVGRLSANKRPDEAIQAFYIATQTVPDAVMWVLGTGPMEVALRRSAPTGVEFLGRVTDQEKMERLARAHALVLTSVREGWGLVVTEAAAMWTPTIGYDVPGLCDSIQASGGVLTAANPVALGTALAKSLTTWTTRGFPPVSTAGTVPWSSVAEKVLATALRNRRVSATGPTVPSPISRAARRGLVSRPR